MHGHSMWAARSSVTTHNGSQGKHRRASDNTLSLAEIGEPTKLDQECLLKDVMCTVGHLLKIHEVKLALQLVDDFATAPIASAVLMITADDLREAFARFIERRQLDITLDVGGDGMHELEKCAKGEWKRTSIPPSRPTSSLSAPNCKAREPRAEHVSFEGHGHIHGHATQVEPAFHPRPPDHGVDPHVVRTSIIHSHPALPAMGDSRDDVAGKKPGESGFSDVVDLHKGSNTHMLMSHSAHAPPGVLPPLPSSNGVGHSDAASAENASLEDRVLPLHGNIVHRGIGRASADILPPESQCQTLVLEECDNVLVNEKRHSQSRARNSKGKTDMPSEAEKTSSDLEIVHIPDQINQIRSLASPRQTLKSLVNKFRNTATFVSLSCQLALKRGKTGNLKGADGTSVVPTSSTKSGTGATSTNDTELSMGDQGSARQGAGRSSSGGNKERSKTLNMHVNESWWSCPSNRFILSPNANFRIVWDIMSLLFIINESILVPLGLCFEIEPGDEVFWISTCFFSADIVCNFFTGYFNDGVLVMKQYYIVIHYMRTWFGLDAASTFPWHYVFSSGNATMLKFVKFGKLTRVLRLLRVAKISLLMDQLEELFASSGVVIMLKLMKILAFMGLLCHWCACIWGWIGHPSRFTSQFGKEMPDRGSCEPGGPCEPSIHGSAWRRRYGLEEETLGEQYLFALRFAAGIFTGSDFGIQPGFWGERLFVIALMFTSFLLCSTIVSKIVIIFHKMNQDRQDQEELMLSFKEFMVAGRVPFQLQAKIKRYLEFQFKSRKDLQVRRFELMEKLSPWLRKELQVHLNRSVLSLHTFFRDMPGEILAHTCCLATCVLCAPGDVVMQKGQNIQCMYFVVKGKLTIAIAESANKSLIMEPNSGSKESLRKSRRRRIEEEFVESEGLTLTAPGYIGASSLFRDEVRPYTVSSLAHSELLKLAREDIEALLQEFPALRSYIEEYKISRGDAEEGYQDCSLPKRQRFKSLVRGLTNRDIPLTKQDTCD